MRNSICKELCKKVKATNGAEGKAPCAVAIRMYLESEVTKNEGD